jgi:outer membrane protein assembly factor BamB
MEPEHSNRIRSGLETDIPFFSFCYPGIPEYFNAMFFFSALCSLLNSGGESLVKISGYDGKLSVPVKKSVLVLSVLILWLLIPLSVSGQDWPWWRGPDRNGISSETEWDPSALAGTPKTLWQVNVGIGFSPLAVKGQFVYTMGNTANTDSVYCLDIDTGETVWKYSYACRLGSYPGPRVTPTIDDNRLYTLSREGHLFSFDAQSGKVIWQKHLQKDFKTSPPQWDFAGSVVVTGDLLLLNAGKSGLAVNKNNGKLVWDSGRGPGAYATPVLYDHRGQAAAVLFGSRAVYGVRLRDGKVLWSYPWETSNQVNAADPIVFDDKVFLSSAYGYGAGLIDISGRKPDLIWKSGIYEAHFSSFVLIDGFLYGIDGDARQTSSGVLRCVEYSTGKERWHAQLGFGSIIAAGDYLIMLNATGLITVAEINNKRYRKVAQGQIPLNQYWAPPVLVRGRLFCRSVRGDIYCLDL